MSSRNHSYASTFASVNCLNVKIYGSLTLVSLLYGIHYSVLKIVVPNHIGAFGFILYRVAISTAIFWIFNLFVKEKVHWRKDGWRLLLCALTGVAVNQLMFYKGISLTSAVNGSIIMTLTPILVLIWSSFLIGARFTRQRITGILIGLIGAVIIMYRPGTMSSSGDWRGDLFILLNGASYACYLVIVKPLMSKYKPMTVVTWIFTLGTILVLPVGYEEASMVAFGDLPPKVWGSMIFAIVGVTVIVYFLNAWTLIKVDASVVGAFIYLQPIFATMTAILFFNELFLVKHLIASIFVFLGVWLVTKK